MAYGKPTLPTFLRNPEPMVQFGKRNIPPVATAYECWMPDPLGFGSPALKPKAIVRAQNSFEARREYAAHHGIEISDVCARRIEKQSRRFS